jgi:acetate kinase
VIPTNEELMIAKTTAEIYKVNTLALRLS